MLMHIFYLHLQFVAILMLGYSATFNLQNSSRQLHKRMTKMLIDESKMAVDSPYAS